MNVRLVLFVLALCAAPATVSAAAKPATASAPADEYFGPQKMSALGIRERIDVLGRRYHARTATDGDLVHDAEIAQASLAVWSARYPHDPWLAPTTFHLEQLYAAIQSPEARAHATTLLHTLAGTYGATNYGHVSRLRLAQGWPALHAESAVVSPAPTAAAAAPETSAMPSMR